jgi:Domain of unknown function (DUF4430)
MPFSRTLAPGAVCLALIAALLLATGATAASTTAQLRVVNTTGTTLADQSQVTGDVSIKTDPGATCFGPPGGSGNTVNVPGPSALGIVKDASDTNAALRPLSITDQFSFGLGICGIGGSAFNQGDSAFWYLKVNHVGAQVGGDQLPIKANDEVLWYLSPGFPPPSELQLVAPPVAQSGKPFTVRVSAFSDSGQKSPVAGALVTGAQSPTGADGTTAVTLTQGVALQALHGADIPSNKEIVCVVSAPKGCSTSLQHKIVGTKGRDRIRGTKSPDSVKARAGDDKINTRGGLTDAVNCGRGKDIAKLGATDTAVHCEKVIRP